jgi:hypothetical protein
MMPIMEIQGRLQVCFYQFSSLEASMKKAPLDVKILAAPGAGLDVTTQRVWATAERVRCGIAVEQVRDPRQIAFYGALATPALVVSGQLVHTGCVPSGNEIQKYLQH